MKVKIGILGCADIAKRYAIKAFQSIDNCEVVSIASRDIRKAQEWASLFNIPQAESYDELLQNKDVDAVYIPLPVGLHKEWTIKAATAGKHVLCEKSLAGDFKSVQEMVEACRKAGVILYENFMSGYHPQHQKVISLINEGVLGKLFIFRGYFGFPPFREGNIRYDKKLGGGSLNDAGAHIVFMARKIFGSEPLSVSCSLVEDKKLGVDVQGTAMFEFPNERGALIGFSFSSAYQNNYSVWGSQTVINVKRAYSIGPEMKPILELVRTENYEEMATSIDVDSANQFELTFHDFCDTILYQSDRSNKVSETYLHILNQAKAMEAMRLSSLENRSVKIQDIK